MRRDLFSLFRGVFSSAILGLNDIYNNRVRTCYMFISRTNLRGLLAFLRYNSFVGGTTASDVTGFERVQRQFGGFLLNVIYIFYLPRWNLRLCLIAITGVWGQVSSCSEFFGGII